MNTRLTSLKASYGYNNPPGLNAYLRLTLGIYLSVCVGHACMHARTHTRTHMHARTQSSAEEARV